MDFSQFIRADVSSEDTTLNPDTIWKEKKELKYVVGGVEVTGIVKVIVK